MTPPPPGPGPGPFRTVRTAAPDLKLVKGGPFLPVNSLGMEFVPIEAGQAVMGAPEDDMEAREYERPAHRIVITKPFGLGRHPVTQEQWERVMGYNPSLFKGSERPVESVTWEEACQFIRRLNLGEKGDLHRLPTEAEWEYCARAGESVLEAEDPRLLAWYSENSNGQTWPVGGKRPNAWGLFDMLGNVWEWVFDWYGDYPEEAKTDPLGPSEGSDKVIRGGAWGSSKPHCRVFTRSVKSPGERSPLIGLRLVRDESLTSQKRFSAFHGWGR
jgi:formylglycine-generating enzyme required for sulfatase activity